MFPHEALERVPEVLGLFEHLCLGVHDGSDLRPPLGAAQLILPVDRSPLFVTCEELPGERAMVTGGGAVLPRPRYAGLTRAGPGLSPVGITQAAPPQIGMAAAAATRA